MKENKDKIYLERILESIKIIEHHLGGFSVEQFASDRKTYDAVLMQIINIGEMINHLSDDFREKHNKLPWHDAIGMRNQITHGYFEVKKEVVWSTAKEDLPSLKQDIDDILK